MEKKFCRNCGGEIPKDSLFCQKCGTNIQTIESGPKNKASSRSKIIVPIIALILIVVVGAYYFSIPKYDTEKAEELRIKANQEIEDGNKLMDQYIERTNYYSERWKETWKNSSGETNAITLLKDINTFQSYKNTLQGLSNLSYAATDHYEKAKLYSEEMKELRLPEWYYEYLDLKIDSLEARQEAINQKHILDENIYDALDFFVAYNEGSIEVYTYLDELNSIANYLDISDYDRVETSLKDATKYIEKATVKWRSAYNLIPIRSLFDNTRILDCHKEAYNMLLKGVEYEKNGSMTSANLYYDLFTKKFESCGKLASSSNMSLEFSRWINNNIDFQNDNIQDIMNNAKTLDDQAEELYRANNS